MTGTKNKGNVTGSSLADQWLRLHTSNYREHGFDLWSGN